MDVTSTVLDATLCLLLVSAAVVAVVTSTPRTPAGDGRADEIAETLATTTATVNYSVPSPRPADGEANGSRVARTTHDTFAGLLARAAISNVTVDGERTSHAHDAFRRRVVRRVERVVRPNRTSVHVVWRPALGTDVRGEVLVGTRPPPNVDVHAATLTVPSGYPSARDAALDAAEREGLSGVANVTAERTESGLFPPERTRFALQSGSPVATTSRRRYRRFESQLGLAPTEDLRSGRVHATNARLTDALAARFGRRFRTAFDDPASAARSVRVGRVRITVRTWS